MTPPPQNKAQQKLLLEKIHATPPHYPLANHTELTKNCAFISHNASTMQTARSPPCHGPITDNLGVLSHVRLQLVKSQGLTTVV